MRIPFDYLLISWVINNAHNHGYFIHLARKGQQMHFMSVNKSRKRSGFVTYSYTLYFKDRALTTVKRDAKFKNGFVKGIPLICFVNRRYTKGVPFPSKMLYKRVRVESPCIKLCWVAAITQGKKTLPTRPVVMPCSRSAIFKFFLVRYVTSSQLSEDEQIDKWEVRRETTAASLNLYTVPTFMAYLWETWIDIYGCWHYSQARSSVAPRFH